MKYKCIFFSPWLLKSPAKLQIPIVKDHQASGSSLGFGLGFRV